MEKDLVKKFYQLFWVNIAFCICILFVVILLFILRNKLINHYDNVVISKVIVYSVIFILLILETIFIIRFIPYGKDLAVIHQKDFQTITGTVVEYTYIREGNDPNDPILLKPIIKDINSVNQIKLMVTGTKLNHTYTFMYLPNTRIAIIISSN